VSDGPDDVGISTSVPTYVAPALSALPDSASYSAPAILEVQARRRRFIGSKQHPTISQWVEVRRLHSRGEVSITTIARRVGLSRRAVREILFPWG
jgi:hypothetical protein